MAHPTPIRGDVVLTMNLNAEPPSVRVRTQLEGAASAVHVALDATVPLAEADRDVLMKNLVEPAIERCMGLMAGRPPF